MLLFARSRRKALFRAYTDATYKTLVNRPNYFGNLGPLISAEVGDVVHVELKVRVYVCSCVYVYVELNVRVCMCAHGAQGVYVCACMYVELKLRVCMCVRAYTSVCAVCE